MPNPDADGRTPRFAERLFAGLPARYDVLAEVLSFGQNARWRAELVRRTLTDGPRTVCDVATGPAGVAIALARHGEARVVGADLSAPMLARAGATVAARGLESRILLVQADGARLPFADAAFDALSFTYLLRYVAEPAAVVAELARVVRPGGVVASLEFAVPPSPGWRTAWWGYTRAVLPIAGALTGGRAWYDVGRFLGPSISAHDRRFPLPWLIQAWRDAGVADVGYRRMSLGGGLVMWGRRVGG